MVTRKLVAYTVVDVAADPIPKSRFGVPVEQVTKRGYVAGAVCRHCVDGLMIVQVGSPWVHQPTGIQSCLESRIRTGEAHPTEAHLLERHPQTQAWYCPTCQPQPPARP